jgi:Flp pilus assembly protein CpaB
VAGVFGRRWRVAAFRRRLLAAGLAFVAVLLALSVLSPSDPRREPVVVAAQDLPAGHLVRSIELRVALLPPASVPGGAAVSVNVLAGRVLAGALRRGEPVTDVRLVGRALLDGLTPGLVAVPVRLADTGMLTLVEPGDRVDVLAAATAEAPDGGTTASSSPARLVAAGARVLAVPPRAPPGSGSSGGSSLIGGTSSDAGSSAGGIGPPLMLAVDRTTAADLAGAAAGRLSLELSAG